MTTIHIEDSTPEGRFLIDLIKNHKSVTIESKNESDNAGTWSKACAEGAVSLDEFSARFETSIREAYRQ